MSPAPLLARYAEGLFWMARYLERVENLARLLDITQTFEAPGREAEVWAALVAINADEKAFAERHGPSPDAATVKRFYLLDRGNETSIPYSTEWARMNARTLRPLISTEMWMQLNVFHRQVMAIEEADLEGDRLSRLCRVLREGVQSHTGVTEGTFFRDQGWTFYQLGRLIERADQTTRLLDIKYHLLSAPPGGAGNGEERRVAEQTQWSAVLRAAAGYHAFRRVTPAGFAPADVVSFLLADGAFPRSVALCVDQMEWHLTQLRARYGLHGADPALERVEELRGALATPVGRLLPTGLHDYLDGLQRSLLQISLEVGTAFFRDWRPLAQAQSQSQSQSGGGGGTAEQSQSQAQTQSQSQPGAGNGAQSQPQSHARASPDGGLTPLEPLRPLPPLPPLKPLAPLG